MNEFSLIKEPVHCSNNNKNLQKTANKRPKVRSKNNKLITKPSEREEWNKSARGIQQSDYEA